MPTLPEIRACTKPARWAAVVVLILAVAATAAHASSAVYRWVDASGITHLSSEKPPAGIKYERVVLASTGRASSSSVHPAGPSTGARVTTASAAQVARRNDVVTTLRTRECVVALESIDRMAKGGQAVDAAEFRRLQQTADLNC